MYKSLFLFFVLFNNILLLKAQNSTNSIIIGQGDFSDGLWINTKNTQKQIEGSPYLFTNWFQKGKIYVTDKVYVVNNLNYNIQAERFEAKISDDSVFALNHGSFYKIEIQGKVFTRHLDPHFNRNSYFENVIKFKNKQILKKYILKVKEGQINPMTMQKIKQDRFIKGELYFIFDENTTDLIQVKLNKSTVLSWVEDDKKLKVKNFAKEHNLSFNRNDNIIEILNYYNSL
ncbi:MAG: hypothetical protein K9I95_00915 [Flavobacteriaceae bacterium]|nr:hypothetical protein [Flavobacteriaceae bacterium]